MHEKKIITKFQNVVVGFILLDLKDFLPKNENMHHSFPSVTSRLLVCGRKHRHSQMLNRMFNVTEKKTIDPHDSDSDYNDMPIKLLKNN